MGFLNRRPAAVLDGSLLLRKGEARPIPAVETLRPKRIGCRPARGAPRTRSDVPKTVATTVRLDPDLYLRLRLYATHTDRTRQNIMQSAIASYLADGALELGGNCSCLNGDKKSH